MDGAPSLWHSGFMKPLEQTKEDIADVLRNHEVVLGYVFGSYARGEITPLSDVDVAVVFGNEVPRDNYFKRELAIAGDLGKLLSVDRVDIVNLKTVLHPLLRQRAGLRGVCILDEDHESRLSLERQMLQEYEDTQRLRNVQSKILHNQLQQGTFGKPLIAPYAYGAH